MIRTREPRLAPIAARLFAASVFGVALGLVMSTPSQAGTSKGDTPTLEFTAAENRMLSYLWQLEGETSAVSRVSGGWTKARVETSEVNGSVFKQVVGLAHEAVTLELDLASLPGATADWVNESFEKGYGRRSGIWTETDVLANEVRTREFYDAHIIEIRLPLLDASSKEPAPVELTFSAELVEDGAAPSLVAAEPAPEQDGWQVNNFVSEIDGLPCARILQVDQIVIQRTFDAEDAPFEIANLVLRFPAEDGGPWADWFESFVIDGNSSDADEVDGSITLLAPDQEAELGRLELDQVGIVALSHDLEASAAAGFDVMRAELYVENVHVALGGAAR